MSGISHSGFTPEPTTPSPTSEESEVKLPDSDDDHSLHSNEDKNGPEKYKNEAYWQLPENVRHAIDLSKKKSLHTDFSIRLSSLNEKIGVYK